MFVLPMSQAFGYVLSLSIYMICTHTYMYIYIIYMYKYAVMEKSDEMEI